MGAGGLGFESRGRSNRIQCRQRLVTAVTSFRSYVTRALSRGDGPRHKLHVLVRHHECNDDLIFGILRMKDQACS